MYVISLLLSVHCPLQYTDAKCVIIGHLETCFDNVLHFGIVIDEVEYQTEEKIRLFDEPDALSNMVLMVEDVALYVHKEVSLYTMYYV